MTISKHMISRGGLLAMAAFALAIATPALAGSATGPDVVVSYSDLNLDSVDGATDTAETHQGGREQCMRTSQPR